MRLLVIIVLIGVASARPQRDSRIVGGSPVAIERYPFMASMLLNFNMAAFEHLCGGTLITRTTVVSAAHCYDMMPVHEIWWVRLGSSVWQTGGSKHASSQIILHRNYRRMLWINDIAIIRLATPAPLSARIQPARIAGHSYTLPHGLRVYIAGWGATHPDDNDPSDILLHTYVRVVDNHICAERYDELTTQGRNRANVTPSMMCAGLLDVGGQDACAGDSGGPVIHAEDVLVGITSWGFGCAHPRFPGVSTRVSSFVDWIVENAVA